MKGYFALACLGLAWLIQAGEHDKKPPVPNRGLASVRAEMNPNNLTASDSDAVLRDLQSSLDEFYSVTKGVRREPAATGETNRPSPFWSLPK